MKLCKCGCQQPVVNLFAPGHNVRLLRTQKRDLMLRNRQNANYMRKRDVSWRKSVQEGRGALRQKTRLERLVIGRKSGATRKLHGIKSIRKGKTVEEIYGPERGAEIRRKNREARFRIQKRPGYRSWQMRHLADMRSRRTEEHIAQISHAMKEKFKDDNYKEAHVRRTRLASHQRPTRPEKVVGQILGELYPGRFQYTGDGKKIIIKGKIPDFFDEKTRSVVLVHGTYWHLKLFGLTDKDRITVEQRDIDFYKKHGFECIVVWEDEISEQHISDALSKQP